MEDFKKSNQNKEIFGAESLLRLKGELDEEQDTEKTDKADDTMNTSNNGHNFNSNDKDNSNDNDNNHSNSNDNDNNHQSRIRIPNWIYKLLRLLAKKIKAFRKTLVRLGNKTKK